MKKHHHHRRQQQQQQAAATTAAETMAATMKTGGHKQNRVFLSRFFFAKVSQKHAIHNIFFFFCFYVEMLAVTND